MTKVLFVCMGNICRSPTAEAVFRRLAAQRGLLSELEVDSAGTHGYHVGESPDARTQRAAAERKYDLSQLVARKVAPEDLEYFDLVLAMDDHWSTVLAGVAFTRAANASRPRERPASR